MHRAAIEPRLPWFEANDWLRHIQARAAGRRHHICVAGKIVLTQTLLSAELLGRLLIS
jgi:hypothetical protein